MHSSSRNIVTKTVLLFLLLQVARDLGLVGTGSAQAVVQLCSCTHCGDVTYCNEMGHNIVPVGIPARGMKRLLLNGNNIRSLYGGDFRDMSDLTMLVLNNNSIRNIDSNTFRGLTKLDSLHLEYNDIEYIPSGSLRQLKQLKKLFLDHNRLATFPGDIPYLYKLEKLTLAHNRLTSIYWASFIQLDQLQALTIWQNPLTCDCNTIELIKWFATTSSGQAVTGGAAAGVCQESDAFGKGKCAKPTAISIQHIRNNEPNDNRIYLVNEKATLHCNVTGSPPPLVVWQTKAAGFVYPFGTGRIVAYPNGTLVISKLAKSDSGAYICYARHSGSAGAVALNTSLLVTEGVKPEAEAVRAEIQVPIGGDAKLYCRVTGIPRPDVVWNHVTTDRFYHERNTTEQRYSLLNHSSVLEVRDARESDGGEWRCVAWSSQGNDFSTIKLTVTSSGMSDATIAIIGACAGALLLVVVAVVTAMTCIARKRRQGIHEKQKLKKPSSNPIEDRRSARHEATGEVTTSEEKRKVKREEKEREKGGEKHADLSKADPGEDILTVSGNEDISSKGELKQPFEYEPEVRGFRL